MCLNTIDIFNKRDDPNTQPKNIEEMRKYFSDFLGLSDLVAKIIKASKSNEFVNFKSHMKLLNEGSPFQNSKSSVLDQSNNKLFELFFACICINAGASQVELDNPAQSKGDNPDIIATFNSVRWGFGCKALHSNNGKTIYGN